MFVFPTSPVDPRVFFEESVPALFAVLELDEAQRAMELRLGVVLIAEDGLDAEGQGGEWTLHLVGGELAVVAGREPNCDLTIVQRVGDWRSALWEGRPRLISEAVATLVASGPDALRSAGFSDEAGDVRQAEHPAAMKGLSDLQGLIEAVIADDPDGADAEGWRVGVQLGPGPIPESPQATIRLGAEQAEAIRRGELHPIEALITGQLRLEGDLGLILQLQAVAMMMSTPPSARD